MNEVKLDDKPVEKLFYKYRPINQHLFDTLEYNELYFRDPRDYNDPIDSVVDGYYEDTFDEFVDYMIKSGMSRKVAVDNMVVGIALGDYQITGNKFRRTFPEKEKDYTLICHISLHIVSAKKTKM